MLKLYRASSLPVVNLGYGGSQLFSKQEVAAAGFPVLGVTRKLTAMLALPTMIGPVGTTMLRFTSTAEQIKQPE